MLEKIKAPSDVKKLTIPELEELSADIRKNIIDTVDANGGISSYSTWDINAILTKFSAAGKKRSLKFARATGSVVFRCFPKACMTHSGRGMREVLFRRALGIVLQEMRASRIIR